MNMIIKNHWIDWSNKKSIEKVNIILKIILILNFMHE